MDPLAMTKINNNVNMNLERIFERIIEVQEEYNVSDEALDVWLKDTWGDELADMFIEWREGEE